jgi:hypothetical protein
MPYTNHTGDAGATAARSLIHLGQTLLETTLELGLAVALGSLGARWLRRRGLHWSWAAAALVPASMLERLIGSLGPAVLVGLASAALRGRRRHR